MIRWLHVALLCIALGSMVGVGVVAGLFLRANSGWVVTAIPPWLEGVVGHRAFEIQLPILLAGWLAASVLLLCLLIWSGFYVWRRRQYESLIDGLERQLTRLRNLPFTDPAPLEDLDEKPDLASAKVLEALERQEIEEGRR